jgi:hypothetical protein
MRYRLRGFSDRKRRTSRMNIFLRFHKKTGREHGRAYICNKEDEDAWYDQIMLEMGYPLWASQFMGAFESLTISSHPLCR